jgi:sulfur carrier protein
LIKFTVNQTPYSIAKGSTIFDLVVSLQMSDKKIAVEQNHNVITRHEWKNTKIKTDDKIEIIHAIGGG